jgi:hypothetical protein
MRAMRCVLTVVLAAGIVTVVAAQPGGRGGFGGFGGGQDVYATVLTNEALQTEIKATEGQKDKFKAIVEKRTEMSKKVREKYGKDAFTEAQGDKEKMVELFQGMAKENAKVTEETHKLVDAELTADQKKRLKQISIQAMNFEVFSDPDATPGKDGGGKGGRGGKGGFGGFGLGGMSDAQKAIVKEVQSALKLSDEQKGSIKTIVADYNKDAQGIRQDAGFGKGGGGFGKNADPDKLEAMNKKIDKVRKEAWGKVEEVLTDTQKTAWKELVGDAFDTSKLRGVPPKKD